MRNHVVDQGAPQGVPGSMGAYGAARASATGTGPAGQAKTETSQA